MHSDPSVSTKRKVGRPAGHGGTGGRKLLHICSVCGKSKYGHQPRGFCPGADKPKHFCRVCGKDPRPNMFLCRECHSIKSDSYDDNFAVL